MVFAPVAFRVVRDNPDYFTGSGDDPGSDRKEEQKFHAEWLSRLPEESRAVISELVCRLFPRASGAINNRGFSRGFEIEWRDCLRVCAAEIFPRYFQLCVPVGAISEAEWTQIVRLLPDSAAIDARVRQLCQQRSPHGFASRAKEFLERASVYAKRRASLDEAKLLFQMVLRNGDTLVEIKDEEAASLISISNDLRVSWAMQEALLRIEDQADREAFVEAAMIGNIGLYAAAHFVWFLGAQHGKFGANPNESHEPQYVSEACVDRLTATLLRRIEAAARDGILVRHPKSMLIAREWRTFGHEAEARQWVTSAASDDRVLVEFIAQLRSVAHSQGWGDRIAREHHRVDANYLATWFDLVDLCRRCRSLLEAAPGWLNGEQQHTLRLLLAAVEEDGTVLDPFDRKRQRLLAGKAKEDN